MQGLPFATVFKEISCERHRYGVGVFVIDCTRRAVGQRACNRAIGGVVIEPLNGPCDIGERDGVLRIGVELESGIE